MKKRLYFNQIQFKILPANACREKLPKKLIQFIIFICIDMKQQYSTN